LQAETFPVDEYDIRRIRSAPVNVMEDVMNFEVWLQLVVLIVRILAAGCLE
jgi:hypothetical protein